MIRFAVLVTLAILLAACGATSIEQQTLTAHDGLMGTALADIYATGTVEAERFRVTLESVDDELAAVGTEAGLMISTLQARGINVEEVPDPISPTPPLNATAPATTATQAVIIGQPQPTIDLNASPTSVQITPFASATLAPRPTNDVVVEVPGLLNNIVLDDTVGDDDCAVSPDTQFTQDTQEIYIIARAVELPDGTTVTTRWQRVQSGEELAVFDFTYGYVEDACVWFYADQSNFSFTPGEYAITVEINGLSFGDPITFTIGGGANTAESTEPVSS